MYTGKSCPSTAASPDATCRSCDSNRYHVTSTGAYPFSASPSSTATNAPLPSVRITFVAPVAPLP